MNDGRFWDNLVLSKPGDSSGSHSIGTLLTVLDALDLPDDEACARIRDWLAVNEPSETLIASIGASRFGKPVFWHPAARSA